MCRGVVSGGCGGVCGVVDRIGPLAPQCGPLVLDTGSIDTARGDTALWFQGTMLLFLSICLIK